VGVCGVYKEGSYEEAWGWLGTLKDPRALAARQITLKRPGQEDVVLVTDLMDSSEYPACDLLELYRGRWGIERMFQQVTEVFGLQALIGSSPEATIFQFAFCMVLYNIIQVVRAYVAAAQKRAAETISSEKLFDDVKRELVAWNLLVGPQATMDLVVPLESAEQVCQRLRELLARRWSQVWLKSPAQKRPAKPTAVPAHSRSHTSVYRVLLAYRQGRQQRGSG
jgi:hypothetical protein